MFGVVGTKLFLLHFRQHLPQTTIDYCEELFRKSARFGIFTSVVMFFAMVGNFGGNLNSVFDSVMVELVLGEKAGEAMVLLLAGFFLCLMKSARHLFVINLVHLVGNFSILLSFAWVGHASKYGLITQSLVVVHFVCLSYWLGAFLPLRQMCNNPESQVNLHKVAQKFGVYALGYVALLILAGLILAFLLLGGLKPLVASVYGNFFLLKLGVVALLLLMAGLNKFRIVPLLLQNETLGIKRLRVVIHSEIALAFFILTITSLLTTSLPLPVRM